MFEKEKVRLNLSGKIDESYDIYFGIDVFLDIADSLRKKMPASRYAIITDSNVEKLHANRFKKILDGAKIVSDIFVLPAGEENKSAENCLKVIGQMARKGYARDSAVIALGGGLVGDMAGFIASIYGRGIPFVQIPTTLLAQTDSAVGGKTGVDTKEGKNLIGTFCQPTEVFVDVATLRTLAQNELINGIAEVIKHGMIRDYVFFKYLEKNISKLLKRDENVLLEISRRNCELKGEVVELDAHEKGLRQILNYGHTIGHAIEKIGKYKIPHGQCVAIGMAVEGIIASKITKFPLKQLEEQNRLIVAAGLPLKIPLGMSNEEILKQTLIDKKARNGKARYALPLSIGKMEDFGGVYSTEVDSKIVEAAIDACR